MFFHISLNICLTSPIFVFFFGWDRRNHRHSAHSSDIHLCRIVFPKRGHGQTIRGWSGSIFLLVSTARSGTALRGTMRHGRARSGTKILALCCDARKNQLLISPQLYKTCTQTKSRMGWPTYCVVFLPSSFLHPLSGSPLALSGARGPLARAAGHGVLCDGRWFSAPNIDLVSNISCAVVSERACFFVCWFCGLPEGEGFGSPSLSASSCFSASGSVRIPCSYIYLYISIWARVAGFAESWFFSSWRFSTLLPRLLSLALTFDF